MNNVFRIALVFSSIVVLSTSVAGSATLQSPADGTAFNYGETIDFTVEVTGSGGTVKFYRDGVNVENFDHSISGTQTYTSSYTPNSGSDGSHTWSVYYTGSNDGSDEVTPTRDYEVQEDAFFADLAYTSPAEGASFTADSVTFEGEVSTQEPGTLSVIADTCSSTGTEVGSKSVGTGNTAISVSEDYSSCFGDKNWYLKYTGDDGSTETSSFIRSFTVESDASQANINYNSPNDNANIDGDINQEASITYDFDFSGPSGELKLREDGVEINNWFPSSDSSSVGYDYTVTNNVGNYGWNVEYIGDDGSSEQFSVQDYEIEDYADRTSLSLDSPLDGSTVSSSSVDFEYSGSGESGDIELYVDGSFESSKSFSSGSSNSFITTVNGLSNGAHDWYVKYEGDDGSSRTSSTRTVNVDVPTDAEQTTLTNDKPVDGTTFTGLDSTVNYEYSVSGNPGTVEIISDTCSASGESIHTDTYSGGSSQVFSYSTSYSCEGVFDWNIRYTGDDGSSKSTSQDSFTVESDGSATTVKMVNPVDSGTVESPNGDVKFNYSAQGEAGTLYLYVDGAEVNSDSYAGSSSQTFSYTANLNVGSHTWHVDYLGGDGSWNNQTVSSFTVVNDASDAGFDYLSPSNGFSSKNTSIDFRFDLNASSGDTSLFVDGTERNSWSHSGGEQQYEYTVSDLSVGSHSWYVEYNGDDGSTATGNIYSFEVVESEGPSISFEASSSTGTQIKNWVLVNVSVSDSSGVDTVIEDFNGTNSSFNTNQGDYYWTNHTGLSIGSYSFQVWANDSNGNFAESGTRSVEIVENRAPSISIVDPDNVTYTDDNIPVDVLSSEPDGHSYSCSIKDNDSVIGNVNDSSQTFKTTISQGMNGSFSLNVDCSDEFGKVSNDSIFYSINTSQVSDETDSPSTGGGGGGSSISTPDSKVVTFIQRLDPLQVNFGSTGSDYFSATNRLDQRINVTVSVPDSPQCEGFELEDSEGIWSDSVEYSLPADDPLTGNDYKRNINYRFSMPMESEFQDSGDAEFSCELSTSSGAGSAEGLSLNVKGTNSSFALLVDEVNSFVESNPWQTGLFVFLLVATPLTVRRFW